MTASFGFNDFKSANQITPPTNYIEK